LSAISLVVSLAGLVTEVPARSGSAKCAQGAATGSVSNSASRYRTSGSAHLLGSALAGTSANANGRCQYYKSQNQSRHIASKIENSFSSKGCADIYDRAWSR